MRRRHTQPAACAAPAASAIPGACLPAARRALAAAAITLTAAALLAGCGGDASWCFNDGSGRVSAGYNTTQCPPDPAGQKQQTPQDAPDSAPQGAADGGNGAPPQPQGTE